MNLQQEGYKLDALLHEKQVLAYNGKSIIKINLAIEEQRKKLEYITK